MERLIAGIGREPRQRTTLYGAVPAEREAASRAAIALDPIVNNAPQTTKSKQTNFKPSPPARDAVRASQGD